MSQQEMQERPHSPISGSKINKFIHCPTAFWADERDLIDTSPKTAAKEGERAHDIAEQCLIHGEEALEGVRNKLMREGALTYRQYIRGFIRNEQTDIVSTEGFLCMGNNFGIPDNNYIGGYYDAMIEAPKRLHLFDYKFGFHVVEPDTNQLTFYILAFIMTHAKKQGYMPVWTEEIKNYIKSYTFNGEMVLTQAIIQPKRKDGSVHKYELPIEKLYDFVDNMANAVARYMDIGKFDDNDCETNDYCQYCEKRLFCKHARVDEFHTPTKLVFKSRTGAGEGNGVENS